MKQKKRINIAILLGGRGKRLGKFTKKTPKPIIEIKNYVFLDYLLGNLIKNKINIRNIYFITGYKGIQIKNKYKNSKIFKNIKIFIERKLEGTGKAIYKFKKNFINNDTIIMNGDTLFQINFNKFIDFSQKQKSKVIIALANNKSYKSNKKLSSLKINKNIIFFSKNKNLMNGGIYYIKKNFLKYLTKDMNSFENDFISKYISNKMVSGLKFNEPFLDIGTKKNLIYARKNFPSKIY